MGFGRTPAFEAATDQQLYQFMRQYYLWCALALFIGLLLIRLIASRVYRSAVLKVIRRGRISRDSLHPKLREPLDRLGLLPRASEIQAGRAAPMRAFGRWFYRRALFAALFGIWLLFAAKVYVGEFLNYHPGRGFANIPIVQLPFNNYMPPDLEKAARP